MMYITNYNLSRFLSGVTADKEEIDKLLKILHSDFKDNEFQDFFSTYDLKRLAGAKVIFESTVGLNNSNLNALHITYVTPNENPRAIFANKAPPAYHKDRTCEMLNSDFTTTVIPQEIIHIANKHPHCTKEFLELYRSIYTKPCGTLFLFGDKGIDWQALAISFRADAYDKFGIDIPETLLPNPEQVTYKNSKPTELPISPKQEMNDCLDLLDKFIERTLQNSTYKDVYNWRYLSPSKRREFARIRGDNYIQANDVLSELQKSLYEAVISYLKLKTDFNQENFDEQLLIDCGFINCRTCNR